MNKYYDWYLLVSAVNNLLHKLSIQLVSSSGAGAKEVLIRSPIPGVIPEVDYTLITHHDRKMKKIKEISMKSGPPWDCALKNLLDRL